MIQILYYIFFIICLLYGVYFFATGFYGFKKTKPFSKKKAITKFAILIPARNEEVVIENLVVSLKKNNYPSDLFDIYVIINNTTDNTKKISKKAGANVLEVNTSVKTKGEVLLWTKEKLKETNYDAYIVFDADNIVHKDFLQQMNNAYQNGKKVAQGRRDSKNLSDNWLSSSYSIFYYLQNFFFNKSRVNMNLSASINGTGFMVDKEIFDKHFNPKTLTEDVEFTAQCTLNNINVAFVYDAITYDEHTTDFISSWKQRKRWSKGMLQCLNIYKRQLFVNSFKGHNQASFDLLLNFLAPIIQVLTFGLTILLIMFNIFGIKLYDVFSYMFAYTAIFFIATYLFGVFINIFIIKYNKRNVLDALSGIILFIVFIISWIPINIEALLKKDIKWEVIEHKKNDIN